mgnify:CR=1 FL=1
MAKRGRKKTTKKQQKKVETVMHEWKSGKLHSGKPGPGKGKVVKSKKQAVAIAMKVSGQSKSK